VKKKIFSSFIGIILIVFLFEIFLRMSPYFFLNKQDNKYYQADINILTIGDSFTYCVQMKEGERWQDHIKRSLNETEGKKVYIENAGMPGANSYDIFNRLKKIIDKKKWDIIIVQCGLNNKYNLRGFSEYNGYKSNILSMFLQRSAVFRFFRLIISEINDEKKGYVLEEDWKTGKRLSWIAAIPEKEDYIKKRNEIEKLEKQNRVKILSEKYNKIYLNNSDVADVILSYSDILLVNREYYKAINILNKGKEKLKRNEYLQRLIQNNIRIGDFKEVIFLFKEYIKEVPENKKVAAKLEMAKFYKVIGDYREAIAIYKELKIDGEIQNVEIMENMGDDVILEWLESDLRKIAEISLVNKKTKLYFMNYFEFENVAMKRVSRELEGVQMLDIYKMFKEHIINSKENPEKFFLKDRHLNEKGNRLCAIFIDNLL